MLNNSNEKENQLSQKRFQLAKLLRCTEEMLACAQNGDWESVEEMENSRKDEVRACFSNPDHLDTPLIAEALATLIYLNEQISKLVQDAKNKVLASRQKYSNNSQAVSQYQNI